jgi:peroxiredoxin
MTTHALNRRDLLLLAGTTALVGAASGPLGLIRPAFAAPKIGATAPAFALPDGNGKTHSLAEYQGKTVILEWTNHLCPYVGKHYGTNNMQALQRETTGNGMIWLSIISSAPDTQGYVDAAEANKLTKDRKAAPTAVLFDPKGKVGRSYDARVTPHMYIIDAKGSLVYMGGIDDTPTADWDDVKTAKNYVRAALGDMSNGRPVANAVTRAYGCTVKYDTSSS